MANRNSRTTTMEADNDQVVAPPQCLSSTTTTTTTNVSSSSHDHHQHHDHHDHHQPIKPVSALHLLLEERQERRRQRHCYYRPCFLQHPELILPLGGMTQVYGAAGTGKTQLALSMCTDTVFHNHNTNNNNNNQQQQQQQQAIYIGLGGSNCFGMASKRLEAMIKARLRAARRDNKNTNNSNTNNQEGGGDNKQDDDNDAVHSLLSNIFLHWVPNGEELLDLVSGNLHRFLHFHPNVSLVVLDGIANLFRQPEDNDNGRSSSSSMPDFWLQERSTTFFQLSNQCKLLSSTYGVAFLVVNGVTTRIRNVDNDSNNDNSSSIVRSLQVQSSLEPALGLSWNQCVNSSFLVVRGRGSPSSSSVANTTSTNTTTTTATPRIRRVLKCKKSPRLPPEATLDFYVDYGGTFRFK